MTTDVHPDQAAVDAALSTPTTVHWLTPATRIACMDEAPPAVPPDPLIAVSDFEWLDRADNPCLSCVLLAAAAGNRVGEGPKWTDLFGIDPGWPELDAEAPRVEPRDLFADRLLPGDLRAAVADVYATEAVLRRRVAQVTYYAALVWLLLLTGIVAANPDRPLRSAAGVCIAVATLTAVATLGYHAPRNRADQ